MKECLKHINALHNLFDWQIKANDQQYSVNKSMLFAFAISTITMVFMFFLILNLQGRMANIEAALKIQIQVNKDILGLLK